MDTALRKSYTLSSNPRFLSGIHDHVFVLENVLTEDECNEIIDIAEDTGFKIAGLYTDDSGETTYVDTEKRQSKRCILDSDEFANRLWKRIQHAIVPKLPAGLVAKRLNERLRILKYTPGDRFVTHRDGTYLTPDGRELSQYTVLIYLNDDYEGGYTTYFNSPDGPGIPILPKTGSVVIQHQSCLHSVPPLVSGTKYALRTEVMYG